MLTSTEINKMTKVDRIQIMEDIWDTFCRDDEIESPDWHKNVLDERKTKIINGNAEFISINELKNSGKF